MDLQQPPIELWGLQVNEPVTVVTDLLVATICLVSFLRLRKLSQTGPLKTYLLRYFFLMFLATAIGGIIGHAFLWHFTTTWEHPAWINKIIENIGFLKSHEPAYSWKLPGWIASMLSIMFVERAAIEQVKKVVKPAVGKTFKIINIIELTIFMAITLATLNFQYVEFHSGYGLMFVVLSLQGYSYLRTKNRGSKLFLYGVALAAAGALFYMSETGISKWFNHYDISHTFMALAAYLFYLGSVKMLKTNHYDK